MYPGGHLVGFQVSVDFSGAAGFQAAELILDVTASSPVLSASGTDYSAWSFTRNPPLDTWQTLLSNASPPPASFPDFTDPDVPGEAQYEDLAGPFTNGFPPGTQLVGTLVYDLSKFGLTSSPSLVVDITASDPTLGFLTALAEVNPADPNTFAFVTTEFNSPDGGRQVFPQAGGGGPTSAPAPAAWVLAVIGSAVLAVALALRGRSAASRGAVP
jgi:hypothetical protein